MADTPTNPPTGSAGNANKGAQEAFIKFFARLGVKVDPMDSKEIEKALNPLHKAVREFSKSSEMKDSFFMKLPGIRQGLMSIMPDSVRFLNTMIQMGHESKDGADNMEFYNNSLGLFGKGLVNLTSLFHVTGTEAVKMGWMIQGAADIATLGVAALVAGAIALLQALKNTFVEGLAWQDELNTFNKILGGVSRERLAVFNKQVQDITASLSMYGVSLEATRAGIKSFIASGLNMATVMKEDLIKNTMLLSEVSGIGTDALAGFFSSIMRGSKVSGDNIKALGNTWTAFNKSVEESGVLGTVSFGEVQEAITSVGSALLIASNKGKNFTDTLTRDLVSLTGLAKALNVSISELNSKFEEASNLLTSQASGFRALLALSGGANVGNMLTNQFNRTDAMLKTVDTLAKLNAQFGGNLNLLGQVAEQTFGLSKDVAIKLATMSAEQRKALKQAQEDSIRLQNDSMKKSWESVTGTLSAQWERLKNTLASAFQRAMSGSSGVQNFINKITDTIARWTTEINNPNSTFNKVVGTIGKVVNYLFNAGSSFLDQIIPMIEEFGQYLQGFIRTFQEKGFWAGLGHLLYEALALPFKLLAHIFVLELKAGLTTLKLFGMGLDDSSMSEGDKQFLDKVGDISSIMDGAAGKFSTASDTLSGKLSGISDALKKNQQEQNNLNGLRDTDIVIGKNGEFTLAGLERMDLQDEAARLQQENTDAVKENTEATKTLVEMYKKIASQSWNDSGDVGVRAKQTLPNVGTIATKTLDMAMEHNMTPAPSYSLWGGSN
jgi:hypothetical protein